ncbi:MAG: GNAT family N-acetyltransferase [Oscillospiraceae bacterium]|nr:GNAT family N-acetyltransferase [Oscillospiraceae bacterium]
MPPVDHPPGRRAHILTLYPRNEYRKQGIAGQLLNVLLDDAREREVTYVDLDATDMGKPFYETLGFSPSEEYMGLNLLK